RLSDLDPDLAEMLACLEITKSFGQVLQREAAVHHRFDGIRFNRAYSLDLIGPAADRNALQPQPLRLNRDEGNTAVKTADCADDCQMPAGAGRDQRLRHGIGPADFDYVVDAKAIGEAERGLAPVGIFAVVDDVIRPQRGKSRHALGTG